MDLNLQFHYHHHLNLFQSRWVSHGARLQERFVNVLRPIVDLMLVIRANFWPN